MVGGSGFWCAAQVSVLGGDTHLWWVLRCLLCSQSTCWVLGVVPALEAQWDVVSAPQVLAAMATAAAEEPSSMGPGGYSSLAPSLNGSVSGT